MMRKQPKIAIEHIRTAARTVNLARTKNTNQTVGGANQESINKISLPFDHINSIKESTIVIV